MMKKWGKIVTGIFLTAAMLAGTLGGRNCPRSCEGSRKHDQGFRRSD